MRGAEIREAFLSFFEQQGHTRCRSGNIVPQADPTLMFVNAGMVPFKDVFTGKTKRDDTRATSSQKCLRVSGKHNDLENVGVTPRHHTFFEMLGNFSFGDYFKEEAITFAWDFLIKKMQLDPNKMVVTIFGGEDGLGGADQEAAEIWKKVTGYDDARIIRCGAADNFWSMGETGPCGPCTEIHYHLGEGDADPATFFDEQAQDGSGWFEIWNVVFMQFDRDADGNMKPLPSPSVDTGMGLERIAVIKQGVLSNYDTDLLNPVVLKAAELAGKTYGGTQSDDDVSMRVIADHARTAAALISEGVFPDKDGRAYVLRRIMRRAIRHAHRLGIQDLFLHECAHVAIDILKDAFPEMAERRALVTDIVKAEETLFRRTLAQGLAFLRENDEWEDRDGMKQLPGTLAWKLSDTWGFPLDLQRVLGAELEFSVDEEGYNEEREAARERSRGSKVGSAATLDAYHALQRDGHTSKFIGYECDAKSSNVIALLQDGKSVKTLSGDGEVFVKETPFYPEKGGQVGDIGTLGFQRGNATVTDTQTPVEGVVTHHVSITSGELKVGDEVTLAVDGARQHTRQNHSATHLLHWALRKVVGETVAQKGSLVGPERLRFDYSATAPLTNEQIVEVEDLVNEAITANTVVTTDELSLDAAKARGVIGLFDDKYGDAVRVLTIGDSLELCGGTHAARTGDIGVFKIISDSNVAAGVRRIEAATAARVLNAFRSATSQLAALSAALKTTPSSLGERVDKLLEEQRSAQKEIERLQRELATAGTGATLEPTEHDGFRSLVIKLPGIDPKALRDVADKYRDKFAPAVIVVASEDPKKGKALLACSVSKTLVERIHAGNMIRSLASIVGGGGGGRPDFAQAGGPDASKIDDALAHARDALANV